MNQINSILFHVKIHSIKAHNVCIMFERHLLVFFSDTFSTEFSYQIARILNLFHPIERIVVSDICFNHIVRNDYIWIKSLYGDFQQHEKKTHCKCESYQPHKMKPQSNQCDHSTWMFNWNCIDTFWTNTLHNQPYQLAAIISASYQIWSIKWEHL